jgi:hypothetical protein
MTLHVGMALLVSLVLANCQPAGRWVFEETRVLNPCPGGRVNLVKRTTDTNVGGRVRQTVVNTDACLE